MEKNYVRRKFYETAVTLFTMDQLFLLGRRRGTRILLFSLPLPRFPKPLHEVISYRFFISHFLPPGIYPGKPVAWTFNWRL
jgi:hypothetical protein